MEFCKPPLGLSLDGNVAENWRKFKQLFTIYMKASGNNNKESDIKVAIFLNSLGEEAIELFNTFNLTDAERENYDKVLEAFELYMVPKKNVVVERFMFNSRKQDLHEKFDSFYTDLRKLVRSCEFGDQTDSVIRDRIVLGIVDKGLQERLLREGNLSLTRAVEICRAAEVSKIQASTIQNVQTKDVDVIRKKQFSFGTSIKQSGSSVQKFAENVYQCKKCNRKHKRAECPAYGKQCFKCGNMNHFSSGCKMRGVRELSYGDNSDDNSSQPEPQNDFFIESVNVFEVGKMSTNEWTKKVYTGDKEIIFKLDTGAQISVLPLHVISSIKNNLHIEKTNIVLEAYGGSKIKPVGKINLLCRVGNKEANVDFVIVDNHKTRPLLGLDGCVKLDLIKCVDKVLSTNDVDEAKHFVQNNLQIFEGMGKFEGRCNIKVNKNANPIARPPRRIPVSLRPRLEKKLEQLEKQGIIAKVEKPQGWVSNLVVVEKTDGSLRICLDPQDLNKEIKRDHVLIPTVEELVPKLCNKTIFSVLDLKDGFFQIELDKESSNLCTFNSPFGCYRFLRLPMGLSCAPEIFQKRNEKNFGDIPGVLVYFDDLLIAGDNQKQHDEILAQVIKRAKELNIKFNQNKLQYRVSEVKYLGYIFGSSGMRPDPEYVQAIIEMPEPRGKIELQRILGMFNYLRQFIPQASTLSAPLRELLKKDVMWQWLPKHTKALEILKQTIINAPVLAVFNSAKDIIIQADSSKDGLGCCLLQEGRPIAFASRALSEAEKGYAQIEKEFLAIVFAATKFHYLIYGRSVEVLTDHKPLVAIMNKNVGNIVSPRLQRMRIKLLKYQLNLKYLPGKYMYIADLLSRSFISRPIKDDSEMSEIVHSLIKQLQMSETKKTEFEEATRNDVGLSQVIKFWVEGWPTNEKSVPMEARKYFKFKNDISVDEGLVFLNNRVIVPPSLRNEMLKILHKAHCGIVKTKARARQVLFWPGLSTDIANMVSKCTICEKYRPKNIKEPLINHEIPKLPFEKIGSDICELGGQSYLIVGCYLSKWLEIIKIKNKTSDEIISRLIALFSTHGIPKTVVCDNMPYASLKLKQFAQDWGFELIHSSPGYPKSNGFSEKMVGIAKNILRKSGIETDKMYEALLEYRNMPISGMNVSPAQVLMSRSLRTKLPAIKSVLKPKLIKQFKQQVEAKQLQSKWYYDQQAKFRPDFVEGESVLIRVNNHWEPAKIAMKCKTPRSYLVKTTKGNILRRNSYHLRKSNNTFAEDYDDEDCGVVLTDQNNQSVSDKKAQLNNNPNNYNKVMQHQRQATVNKANVYITRSGRVVRQSSRLKDFII